MVRAYRSAFVALTLLAMLGCRTAPAPSGVADRRLSAMEIYQKIAGSLVFVQTAESSGSGVLIEGGWVLTNAHVVRPDANARLVFADGTEIAAAPVAHVDLMGDMALIGPVAVSHPPADLAGDESIPVGSDVYMVGYPMESDSFPQPTIVKGILSRIREWEVEGITFFQTDADTVAGQSGGVLADDTGRVLGISGLAFTAQGFGMVASVQDLSPRIEKMLQGVDVAGIGERAFPETGGAREHRVTLDNVWDAWVFVIREAPGTDLQIDVESQTDVAVSLRNFWGDELAATDEVYAGTESVRATTLGSTPHFLIVALSSGGEAVVRVSSNVCLQPFVDSDDRKRLMLGRRVRAGLDYPLDYDVYKLRLREGQKVAVVAESILVDPWIIVDAGADWETGSDDDSGGGILGLNARLVFEAPIDGDYDVVVSDASGMATGGYILELTEVEPTADALTLRPLEENPERRGGDAVPRAGEESEESIAKWRRFFAIKPDGWIEDTGFFQEAIPGPGVLFGGGKPTPDGYQPALLVVSAPIPRGASLEAMIDAVVAGLKSTKEGRLVDRQKTSLADRDAVLVTFELDATPTVLLQQIYLIEGRRRFRNGPERRGSAPGALDGALAAGLHRRHDTVQQPGVGPDHLAPDHGREALPDRREPGDQPTDRDRDAPAPGPLGKIVHSQSLVRPVIRTKNDAQAPPDVVAEHLHARDTQEGPGTDVAGAGQADQPLGQRIQMGRHFGALPLIRDETGQM